MSRRRRRGAFTLLEMILAMAIGMVILGGVYMALTMQLGQAQAGREATQEAMTARAILNVITADILASLGPYDPKQAPAPTATSVTGDQAQATSPPVLFNIGVQGDSGTLLLSVGKVPREVLGSGAFRTAPPNGGRVSDLRRILYWVEDGMGLMKQELSLATSPEIDTTTPDAERAKKLAPEVLSITFQYWDGGGWVATWDSTALGPDGETPVGSPAAIEITLEMKPRDDNVTPRKYRHVVYLPAGNNYSIQGQ
ncbi:MAG: prepilin-type N-terminal cleavage/methylation domain-containing protein [Gemmataceae bacterium]|nr:prepilin-type N-terminal cleavage/methylation domain-containing protein [Gemmataceae bacterium]